MEDDKIIEGSVTGATPSNGARNCYDLLAYFADFINCREYDPNVEQRLLMSISVDDTKQHFPIQSNSGAASQGFAMKSADFLEPALGALATNPLLEPLAVKRVLLMLKACIAPPGWEAAMPGAYGTWHGTSPATGYRSSLLVVVVRFLPTTLLLPLPLWDDSIVHRPFPQQRPAASACYQ
jgi:hypothetical protein